MICGHHQHSVAREIGGRHAGYWLALGVRPTLHLINILEWTAPASPGDRVGGKQLNQTPVAWTGGSLADIFPINSCPPTAEGERPARYRKTRRVDRDETNQGR
jgi:hypothetical protein